MNIGANIRRIRMKMGMTQTQLGVAVGVTESMICQIERGTKACSMPLGADIARALECEVTDLYDSTDRPA